MKNKIIKSFALFLCLLPDIATADVTPYMQRRCDEMFLSSAVDVEINYDFGGLAYDTSKLPEEMAVLYSQHNGGKTAESAINGLTVQNAYFRLTLDIENRSIKGGYKCYYPSKIQIDTGFKDSTIYISNSLKSGTCRFEQTKRHEHTHLFLGKAGLVAQAELLRKMLPSIIKKQGAVVSDESKDLAEQEIFSSYNKVITDVRQMVADVTIGEQQKLDTKENYIKETALCPKN